MRYPEFFDSVPRIRLRDALAAFLGAVDDGVIEYGYIDAVKLAGHSCPTVASAYGLTRLALRELYGDGMPERGGVRVALAAGQAEGVAGVIAAVATLLTGAAGDGGFKGLAGRYGRRQLLRFSQEIPLEIRYSRIDNGATVDAAADLGRVPAAAEAQALLQLCLAGNADSSQQGEFGRLWQDRVRRILVEHGEDPEVFILRRAS